MSDFSDIMAATDGLGADRRVIMSPVDHPWNSYNEGRPFPHLLTYKRLAWEFTPTGVLYRFITPSQGDLEK